MFKEPNEEGRKFGLEINIAKTKILSNENIQNKTYHKKGDKQKQLNKPRK